MAVTSSFRVFRSFGLAMVSGLVLTELWKSLVVLQVGTDDSMNAILPNLPISPLLPSTPHGDPRDRKSSKDPPDNPQLPQWITDYMEWHNQVRQQYPDQELMNNASAPGILVRYCTITCGGLHDRLGQLPWDLYFANQTRRILLIKWFKPLDLEDFLEPNQINWTLPRHERFDSRKSTHRNKALFTDLNPRTQIDEGIERAVSGEYRHIRILLNSYLGHNREDQLEQRLQALGETDLIHNTTSFGNIWRAMFRPVPPIQQELDETYQKLNLTPGHYSAAHCRVRHPRNFKRSQVALGKRPGTSADQSGLPFNGTNKDITVDMAKHAILCSRHLSGNDKEPIYFFADEEALVNYMVQELPHDTHVPATPIENQDTVYRLDFGHTANASSLAIQRNRTTQAILKTPVVARNLTVPTVHIDRQGRGEDVRSYYSVFVDLYLAMNARCMAFGLGNFGYFASKLSPFAGNCKVQVQMPNGRGNTNDFLDRSSHESAICTPETYEHLL